MKSVKNKSSIMKAITGLGIALISTLFVLLNFLSSTHFDETAQIFFRSFSFIVLNVFVFISIFEFIKVFKLKNWAKYYYTIISLVFIFMPYETTIEFIKNGFLDQNWNYIKEFLINGIANVPGLTYLIFFILIIFPFLFEKFEWKNIINIIIITSFLIIINFSLKFIFFFNFMDALIFVLLSAIPITDTFAYFGGKYLGHKIFKRKLAPKISPNKTIEGAIVGFLSGWSVLFFSLYFAYDNFPFLSNLSKEAEYVVYIVIPIVIPIFSILGDLSFSIIKRRFSVKDFANFLPEHGGLLDRFDSIFVATFVFMIIMIVIQI